MTVYVCVFEGAVRTRGHCCLWRLERLLEVGLQASAGTLHPITSAASCIVQNVLNVYVCIIDDGRGEGTRAAPSINRREHVVQCLMTVYVCVLTMAVEVKSAPPCLPKTAIACYTMSNECVCVYQRWRSK